MNCFLAKAVLKGHTWRVLDFVLSQSQPETPHFSPYKTANDNHLATNILRAANVWMHYLLTHGKEATENVQYWKDVIGNVINIKRAKRYHKFVFSRTAGPNGKARAMNLIHFLAIEGFAKNQPVEDSKIVVLCWDVDHALGPYAYTTKIRYKDMIHSTHAISAFASFRRAMMGVDRLGRGIGARTFGGSIVFEVTPKIYVDPIPALKDNELNGSYNWTQQDDEGDERLYGGTVDVKRGT